MCHRPKRLESSEVAEHFQRLCLTLGSWTNIVRHYWTNLWASEMPFYKLTILGSGREILSIRNAVQNPARRYIGGLDDLETWDRRRMDELRITPQQLS